MARTPERFLNASALAKIASIDPEEFTEKANLFVTAKHAPTVRSHVLLSQVKDSFGETEYARALCTQLVAIATIKRLEAISIEEAIGNIIDSMHLNGISEECQGWYKKVEPEILMLLKSSSVRLVAKALHLSTDYPDLYTNANVITDIRPVFDGDREAVEGAMVSQILRIHFIDGYKDSGEREISLSIDVDDIDKLIFELSKAKTKAEAAKRFLNDLLADNVFSVGEDRYGFG